MTTVWDLADECRCSLSTAVFQLVNVGAWSADGTVDEAVAETVRVLLQDPDHRTNRASHVDHVDVQTAAKALLDARAYETELTVPQVAAATGGTIDAVRSAVQQLESSGLIGMGDTDNIEVGPESARALRAVAEGELALGDYDAPED